MATGKKPHGETTKMAREAQLHQTNKQSQKLACQPGSDHSPPEILLTETDSSNTLQLYMQRVAKYPLLDISSEHATALLAKRGCASSRAKMINSNLRLVLKWAKRHHFNGLQLIDLIEEGNLGLIQAVDKFDPELGFRFSTYATWWIRQAIDRAIMKNERMIRLPFSLVRELKSYNSTSKKLSQVLGDDASPTQVANHLKVSEDRVRKVLYLKETVVSMDSPVQAESQLTLVDTLTNGERENPEIQLSGANLFEVLSACVLELNPMEREIINRRFGLNGYTPTTLEKVGVKVGMTREKVRQIQIKVLDGMRGEFQRRGISSPELMELVTAP